ncbi:amino acid adenylation domain-containing protein [Nocardiopsis ansamitocini]|uniref:D-alanine--poly(Phosphoribitol) ligase n=1 Tax=Nocardiopsis ansamitocini TaxID=1670832 RepID=A0A9W6P6R6_9ACTN|nr:amino acid adenylation domain-containing protein [Nocardiopsis ansamitocini]GLU48210.1 D-alanine--poly(phosphoribitol) ligase [Nocardiopsis ansamitocini]
MRLEALVRAAARRTPHARAVVDATAAFTYRDLDTEADRLAAALAGLGVGAGDRVAMWMTKSVHAVAVTQAALRLGAAYVPIDPGAPLERARHIIDDCAAAAVATDTPRLRILTEAGAHTALLCADSLHVGDVPGSTPAPLPALDGPGDLAYILYTSGSTGRPKGVCLSHANAMAFVDWAAAELRLTATDRLSCHAPLHFDLSVFDLYTAFRSGACVYLVPEDAAYAARSLVRFAQDNEITVWYSVPSALMLMALYGGLLHTPLPALRVVAFAGEPYPLPHLRRLRAHLPHARLFNFYGPTETNVCTFWEVDQIPADRIHPVAIGRACCDNEVWAVDENGDRVEAGEEGELVVRGPTVMLGYWGRAPQTGPYPTGDRVVEDSKGDYHYLGRNDSMVKVRGHRMELGEIESVLHDHPHLAAAAVVVTGAGLEARLVAFLVPAGSHRPDIVDLKSHCATRLPRSMVIDAAHYLRALPRTPNGKVDRRVLAAQPPPHRHP